MKYTITTLLLLGLASPVYSGQRLEDGYDAMERGDVQSAVQIWEALASQNNQTAQLNLGQLYRLGKGVEQDDQEAIKWYTMAANNGSEVARYTLVLMHQEKRASNDDLAKAGLVPKVQPKAAASTSWLATQAPEALLIQIVAASQRERLVTFKADAFVGSKVDTHIIETTRNGEPWVILVAGPYNNRESAKRAMNELPPAAKANGPWIRTVKSLNYPVAGTAK